MRRRAAGRAPARSAATRAVLVALGLFAACTFAPPLPGDVVPSRDLGPAAPTAPDGRAPAAPEVGAPPGDARPAGLDASSPANRDAGVPPAGDADAEVPDGGFPFPVSNVTPGLHPPMGELSVEADETCVFSTSRFSFSGCDEVPGLPSDPVVILDNELPVVVVAVEKLVVDGTLRIKGVRAAIFLVRDEADISGTIDLSAAQDNPGPGADFAGPCRERRGGEGSAGAGGGGGGFDDAGGRGGDGPELAGGARGGRAGGPSELVPLAGGCGGGGNGVSLGGGGGGALQLSVADQLKVSGALLAAGGGGRGAARGSGLGGTGGGSGGALLLEARQLVLDEEARLLAPGGGGGEGSHPSRDGEDGRDGPREGAGSALGGQSSQPGGDGGAGGSFSGGPGPGRSSTSGAAGGGGGGGSAGRIRIQGHEKCEVKAGALFSPRPSSGGVCP